MFAGVSDGAANILKCLSDMKEDRKIKESFRCACHTLHLVVSVNLLTVSPNNLVSIVNGCGSFLSSGGLGR